MTKGCPDKIFRAMSKINAGTVGFHRLFIRLVAFVVCALWLIPWTAFPVMAESPSQQEWQRAHDFYDAIWRGDFSNIMESVKRNPQIVNQPLWTREEPISVAVDCGQLAIAELLLTNRANVNARGRFGETPLHYAALKGNVEMVKLLLKYKADINAQDDDHISPIVYSYKSVEVIKTLLAYGANLNAKNSGNTLLWMAVADFQNAGPGVIEFMITNGVDVSICGTEPISDAVLLDNTNVTKLLLPLYAKAGNPEVRRGFHYVLAEVMEGDKGGMVKAMFGMLLQYPTNDLQKAIIADDIATINTLLLNDPASVNAKDYFDWSPLHLAAITGTAKAAELLIAHGADVNARDEMDNTPLLWAAFFGHEPMVDLLLAHKADVNALGNKGNAASSLYSTMSLELAIRNGFSSIALKLITNGADLAPHDWWQNSPLHIATEKTNIEVMKALLSHAAKIDSTRCIGNNQTPLDIAICGDSPEAVDLLIAHGASLETQICQLNGGKMTLFHLWAERGSNTNIAARLLSAGCDPNATNENGQTPLHIAIRRWKCTFRPDPTTFKQLSLTNRVPMKWNLYDSGGESVIWLLNHRAQANAKDTNGQTALHIIAKTANTKAIQFLLNHGADINSRDKNGKTPLELMEDYKIACHNDWHGSPIPDFKPAEDLLLTNNAIGAIQSP